MPGTITEYSANPVSVQHQTSGQVNSPKFNPSGTISGTVSGASSGGWIGAGIGGLIGLATDFINWHNNKKAAKTANEEARRNAREANAQAIANEKNAREYNTPANQVRLLKDAGLSPGLMYGQMSPINGSAAAVEQAQSYMQSPSTFDSGNAINAFNAYLSALLTESNIQSSSYDNALKAAQTRNLDSQTTSQNIGNETLAQRNLLDLSEIKARIDGLLSTKGLTDEQREQLVQTRESIIALNKANAASATASANYTSGVLTEKGNQDIVLSRSQENLNNAQANYVSGALTNQTQANADYISGAQTANIEAQTREILQRYDVTQSKVNLVKDFLKKHNIDENYVGVAFEFIDGVAKSSGRDLSTTAFGTIKYWLTDGISKIRDRVSQEKMNKERVEVSREFNQVYRENGQDANEIRREELQQRATQDSIHNNYLDRQLDALSPKGSNSSKPSSNHTSGDAVKTIPSNDVFNKFAQKHFTTEDQRLKYNALLKVLAKKDKWIQSNFKRDLYYADDPNSMLDVYYYKYIGK